MRYSMRNCSIRNFFFDYFRRQILVTIAKTKQKKNGKQFHIETNKQTRKTILKTMAPIETKRIREMKWKTNTGGQINRNWLGAGACTQEKYLFNFFQSFRILLFNCLLPRASFTDSQSATILPPYTRK